MQEQDVRFIVLRPNVKKAVGRAAGDAPALSKGGESNGCHCRMSALMDHRGMVLRSTKEFEGWTKASSGVTFELRW